MKFFEQLLSWWHRKFGRSEFLCDTCRYDTPSACRRPERPNARKCPDYRQGSR